MTYLNQQQLDEFRQKLTAEELRLEGELSTIGFKNPGVAGEWTPTLDEAEQRSADPNDQADAFEDLEENTAIVSELEARLKDVREALQKIETGSYGICEKTGEEIPLERLHANPAARTIVR